MKRVLISQSACRDRDSIDDYTIENFGLEQAERLREALADAFISLLRMPESGRLQPDLSPPGRTLRSRIVLGAFLIVYEVAQDEIRVARILHAARNLPSELLRDAGDAE